MKVTDNNNKRKEIKLKLLIMCPLENTCIF